MSEFRPPRRPDARRRALRTAVLLLALLAIVAARRGCDLSVDDAPGPPLAVLEEGRYELVRVVDGDTIIVRRLPGSGAGSEDRGTARVRLIGVDTPETVKPNHPVERWGPEATEFVEEFLSGGELEIRLDRRRKDRYDRFLAYVYVDGKMLNEELARAGLARADHYSGDSPQIARRIADAEQEARRARRGLWSRR